MGGEGEKKNNRHPVFKNVKRESRCPFRGRGGGIPPKTGRGRKTNVNRKKKTPLKRRKKKKRALFPKSSVLGKKQGKLEKEKKREISSKKKGPRGLFSQRKRGKNKTTEQKTTEKKKKRIDQTEPNTAPGGIFYSFQRGQVEQWEGKRKG